MAVHEAAAQPYVRAIQRGFASIGKDFSQYRTEIDRLHSSFADQLGRIAREVEPEFFQVMMTLMVCGSVRAAAEKLGNSKSSLDRRIKEFVAKGGLYATLNGLLAVRTQRLGRRQWDFEEVHNTVALRCEGCNHHFADSDATRRQLNASGAYVAQNPKASVENVGFHWNALCAMSWGKLAEMYLRAKAAAR